MVNTSSMKYNNEFLWLYRKGESIAARNLVLYYKKTKQKNNTLGITVTKKIGGAVIRNRIRRRIRESYRLCEGSLATGYKLIVVARSGAPYATYKQINSDLMYLFKKSGIFTEKKTAVQNPDE